MSELHQSIRHALDGLVDERAEQGNWTRILADADRGSRRAWVMRVAVVVAASAVVVAAALVSPFEDEQQPTIFRTGVLGKALAAIGDGPVIHLVTRGDWGGTLVDLSTGELTPVHAETEVWYDPDRGAHRLSRFGDTVVFDTVSRPGEVSSQEGANYIALANRYRDELKSGKAKVVARGRVGDRAVLWIRVRSQWLPDVADGRSHVLTEEVAVDRETYEPLYMRSTRDGRPPPGAGQLILKLETLPSGEGDFTADEALTPMSGAFGFGLTRGLTRDALARALDGKAVWLGDRYDGKPLVESRVLEFRTRENQDDEWEIVEGVSLFYGSLAPRRGGIRLRDNAKPFVQVLQAAELSPAWRGSQFVGDIPQGAVLIDPTHSGFLRREGVYVSVSSKRVRDVLAAAAALRPVGDEAPAASRLDFDRIARLVERRELVHVEGIAPVRPRSLVPRNKKRIRSAVSKGVTLVTYTGGVARFDTTGMDPEVARVLPERLNASCFQVQGDLPASGAGGWIPRNGVREVVVVPSPRPPGIRRQPVSRRFDACQIGTGFGRNWLPRFDWHWPIEFPLTDRGRRFFEERAAAIELATFVRTGARGEARRAMKRGGVAPPAERLVDPNRPYVAVTSAGRRFRASTTASTGRRFYIEIERGRIGRKNVGRPLAFVR